MMDGRTKATPPTWQLWLLVAVGGTAGAGAREALALLIPAADAIPVSLMLINILGAFLLGFLYEALTRPGIVPERTTRLKLLLGTGFCGGFTSYSAMATDTLALASHGSPGAALAYLFGMVVLGACATWAGIIAGSRIAKPRQGGES